MIISNDFCTTELLSLIRWVRFAIQALLSDGELHTVQALGSNMYNSMSTLNIILEFCTG